MIDLISQLGERVTQRWLTRVFLPGLLYAVLGGWLIAGHDPFRPRHGIDALNAWWQGLPSGPLTSWFAAGALLLAAMVAGYTAETLGHEGVHRMHNAGRPAFWRRRHARSRSEQPTPRFYEPQCLTRTGDDFRLVGARVKAEYRLPIAAAWPRLWLLISPETRAVIGEAGQRYFDSTALTAWGLMYLPWAVRWWPAGLIGAALIAFGHLRTRISSAALAELIESTLDTNLSLLAAGLRVPVTDPRPTPDQAALISDLLTKAAPSRRRRRGLLSPRRRPGMLTASPTADHNAISGSAATEERSERASTRGQGK